MKKVQKTVLACFIIIILLQIVFSFILSSYISVPDSVGNNFGNDLRAAVFLGKFYSFTAMGIIVAPWFLLFGFLCSLFPLVLLKAFPERFSKTENELKLDRKILLIAFSIGLILFVLGAITAFSCVYDLIEAQVWSILDLNIYYGNTGFSALSLTVVHLLLIIFEIIVFILYLYISQRE